MLENILFIMSIIYVSYLIIKLLYNVSKWPMVFCYKYDIHKR